jgi:hypothetical protein
MSIGFTECQRDPIMQKVQKSLQSRRIMEEKNSEQRLRGEKIQDGANITFWLKCELKQGNSGREKNQRSNLTIRSEPSGVWGRKRGQGAGGRNGPNNLCTHE